MSCIIKRILTVQVPVKYRSLHIVNESDTDVTDQCLYSWSTDTVCWTNWTDYDTYSSIGPNIEGDYYLRILLFGGFKELIYDNAVINCYSICLYKENPYTTDPCNGALDLYANLDCALLMQQQLSDLVCCTVGIPVYYFRVTPDNDTKDYTFKEYVLHNVTDVKTLKIVLEDGQMPSSKPQMTEFDFDWENDWEVEIGKTMFATAFGDKAFPKQRDIIYIPLMRRLYEVNAAYEEKQEQLMWRSTTWKLALVKWNEKTNVDQGDFESIIDSWTTNQIPEWLNKESLEQERQSATIQAEEPTFSAINLYDITMQDAIRKSISNEERTSIISEQINHRSLIVARNMYAFKSAESVITYQKPWCYDSGSLSLIISVEGWKSQSEKTILRVGDVELKTDGKGNLIFGDLKCRIMKEDTEKTSDNKTYLVIMNWNRQTFTQSLTVYPHKCTIDNIPLYKIRPEMYAFDFEHPTYDKTVAYNNDYIHSKAKEIILSPAPYKISNLKIYDTALDNESMIRESLKYTTTDDHCIINDLARSIEAPHGYSVR